MLATDERWLKKSIYAPKLPWKKGEIGAFKSTTTFINDFTTPIFLIPPAGSFDHDERKILSPADHIRVFGGRLFDSRQNRPVFVDAIFLDDERHRSAFNVHPLTALIERARLSGARAWPVTSYDRSDDYQHAVAKSRVAHGSPVAMQIRLADLGAASLSGRLRNLCNQLSCDPRDAVLIIDLGPLFFQDESNEAEFADGLINAINQLPHLHDWCQIVLVATSLGELQKVKPHNTKLFRRSEWHIYQRLLAQGEQLLRLPIFSDYGVEYRESLAPIKARPSAKLNYTTNEHQLFVKGANVKTGGYEAIFPVADKIVESAHFLGGPFSQGDDFILFLAQHRSRTGGAPTWRWACADHHLAVVVRGLVQALGIRIEDAVVSLGEKQAELFPIVGS